MSLFIHCLFGRSLLQILNVNTGNTEISAGCSMVVLFGRCFFGVTFVVVVFLVCWCVMFVSFDRDIRFLSVRGDCSFAGLFCGSRS